MRIGAKYDILGTMNETLSSIKRKYRGKKARFLGVDFGEARVGLALSDEGRVIASPLAVVPMPSAFRVIEETIARENVVLVVVGLPLTMKGEEGAAAERAREFAAKIKGAPVLFADERLTSKLAERMLADAGVVRRNRTGTTDMIAAARILQDVLDSP